MKKIKILGIMSALVLMFTATAHAEDVNAFPPQRPEVGVMKVTVSENGLVVVGLRTNGTINVKAPETNGFGNGISPELKNEVLSLTNIVDVACTNNTIVALRADGTVYVGQNDGYYNSFGRMFYLADAANWTDIVAIDCGRDHVVGLKSDGTVVATGVNNDGQCDVMGWNNVSKIYAIDEATFALKKDGSIMATGAIQNFSDLRKCKNATDIFDMHTYREYGAMLADGTVTAADYYYDKEDGGYKENTPLMDILKNVAFNEKVVKVHGYSGYFLLTEAGDLYYMNRDYTDWEFEKLEENIAYVTFLNGYYYAIDTSGQILSNNAAFTSDDWILTTNITYNGNKINSDVPPYIKDGRTLAPIRAILEALGMTVTWEPTTLTATATKDGVTISVTINSNIAIVNGVEKTLDVPAEITNDRTFVPVRFFAEALDMNVDWDGYTKTVIIESK